MAYISYSRQIFVICPDTSDWSFYIISYLLSHIAMYSGDVGNLIRQLVPKWLHCSKRGLIRDEGFFR
jgi:hypothetical protein